MTDDRAPLHGIGHNRPCALCDGTSLHDEDLIEQVAEDLWESRRHGTLDDVPWAECGGHWQPVFRGFAAAAIQSVARRARE